MRGASLPSDGCGLRPASVPPRSFRRCGGTEISRRSLSESDPSWILFSPRLVGGLLGPCPSLGFRSAPLSVKVAVAPLESFLPSARDTTWRPGWVRCRRRFLPRAGGAVLTGEPGGTTCPWRSRLPAATRAGAIHRPGLGQRPANGNLEMSRGDHNPVTAR